MVALQIRDVPEEVRDLLAARAVAEGRSLQSLLLDLLIRETRMWSNVALMEEIERDLAARPVTTEPFDSLEAVHAERREREEHLERLRRR